MLHCTLNPWIWRRGRLFFLFPVIALKKILEKTRGSHAAPRSALGSVQPLLNAYLKLEGRFDDWLVKSFPWLLPAGSSLLAVAEK